MGLAEGTEADGGKVGLMSRVVHFAAALTFNLQRLAEGLAVSG